MNSCLNQICHSLSLSPPFSFSLSGILLQQYFHGWSCRKYLSNDSSLSVYPFSHPQLVHQGKIQSMVQIELLYRMRHSNLGVHPHILCIFSLSCWLAVRIIWTEVYLSPKFESEIKIFSTTFTWGLYKISALRKQTTSGWSCLLDFLGHLKSGLVHGGFRKWSLRLAMSHWIGIKKWS